MSLQTTYVEPEIGPENLTLFQQYILLILADADDLRDYGLGIKRELEERYDGEINHGRVYPNLDTLVEEGLLVKGEIDARTNYYELTDAGADVLLEDFERRETATESLRSGDGA